jgi:hypothetical protein
MEYSYQKEDLLFKVLFDKIYRPKIHSYVLEHSSYKHPVSLVKELGPPTNEQLRSLLTTMHLTSVDTSSVSNVDYAEIKYVEDMGQSRYMLFQKVPFICSLALCIAFGRNLLWANKNMIRVSVY